MRLPLRSLAALALAVGAGACASAPPRPTTPPAEIRVAARLLQMTDTRAFDGALVDSVVRSGPSWLRVRAVLAVGRLNARSHATLLRELLADADTAVAATAAFALGALRDTASLAALSAALRGPPTVHAEAAWSLSRLGEPARSALVAAIGRRPLPEAILATTGLRTPPLDVVVPYLTWHDAQMRWAATYALSRGQTPAAIRPLLEALDAPPVVGEGQVPRSAASDIRAMIAGALARQRVPDSLQTRAAIALAALVGDSHAHVRINAIRSLLSYDGMSEHLRRAIASDPDGNVRVAAAQSAGPVVGRDTAMWQRLWDSDTTYMVRTTLLTTAFRGGVRMRAADTAVRDSWIYDRDGLKRGAAISVFLGPDTTFTRARRFDADTSRWVRAALINSLRPALRNDLIARDSTVARWFMRTALTFPDLFVRQAAINALSRVASVNLMPTLVAAYRRTQNDPVREARQEVIRAIAAVWRADSARFGIWADTLRAWAAPADTISRASARTITPLAHWGAAPAPSYTLADYERIIRTVVVPSLTGQPLTAEIVTNRGTITATLYGSDAPISVESLRSLAARGYFNDVYFHRIAPYFVAQGGDPSGTGNGGPGYAIRTEFSRRQHNRGALGMARTTNFDTEGSQWYLTHAPQPFLDGGYTVFGQTTSGWEVLDALVQWDRLITVRVR